MIKQMGMFDRIKRLFQSEASRRKQDAAELFLEANDKTDTDEAFDAYFAFVNEDPANADAMQQLNEIWDGTGALPNPPYPTAAELANDASAARPFLSAPTVAVLSGLGAAVVLAGFLFLAAPQTVETPSIAFATDPGERRDLVLEDGSTVTLGAASEIEVAIDDKIRMIDLIAGDSYLDVAPDQSRVFLVRAGDLTARAIGTEFSVLRRNGTISVAVSEGIVDVYRGDSESALARLTAGQKVRFGPAGGGGNVETVDIEAIAAWRRGVLILDDEALPYAVETINRYFDGTVLIEGAPVADIRASGVVDMHDPGPWLESLQTVLPVEIRRTGENTYVLSRR